MKHLPNNLLFALVHALNAYIYAARDFTEGDTVAGGSGLIDFVSEYLDAEALDPIMSEHLATGQPVDAGMVSSCYRQAQARAAAAEAEQSDDPAKQQVPGNDSDEPTDPQQAESAGDSQTVGAQASAVQGAGVVAGAPSGVDAGNADDSPAVPESA